MADNKKTSTPEEHVPPETDKFALVMALVLTISVCFGATAIGAYAAPKQINSSKVEVTETNGVIAIPVDTKSIADGEYV